MRQCSLIIVLLFVHVNPFAQVSALPNVINSGGGNVEINKKILFDWSIGELATVETFYGKQEKSNLLITRIFALTNGLLQPFDNDFLFIRKSESFNLYEVRFYPLPTQNNIVIDFKSGDIGTLHISLVT